MRKMMGELPYYLVLIVNFAPVDVVPVAGATVVDVDCVGCVVCVFCCLTTL